MAQIKPLNTGLVVQSPATPVHIKVHLGKTLNAKLPQHLLLECPEFPDVDVVFISIFVWAGQV